MDTSAQQFVDEAARKDSLDQLKQFLRFRTISTGSRREEKEIAAATRWLSEQLTRIGLENVRIIDTLGNPLVYADWLHAPGAPTVLSYGHYDTQPGSESQFEPRVENDVLYGRGATDDKGQWFTHLKAIELLLNQGGYPSASALPCNVKVLLDGGEEDPRMGAYSLDYLRHHWDFLRADCVLISDTEMFSPGLPTLVVGLRGIVSVEVVVIGARASSQFHSGSHGGVAPNPLLASARIIAGCIAEDGRILIPHFYDEVQAPAESELRSWERLPFDERAYQERELEARGLCGEREFPVLYRRWARPTFEVHGIVGGYMEEGESTIIPSRATIKITMRLVPKQDPDGILRHFAAHVSRVAPPWVDIEVNSCPSERATVMDVDSPYIRCAQAALSETFAQAPVLVREGGSIPIVSLFHDHFKIPCVLMGWGLPDDDAHGDNEKLSLANFFKGIEAVARFLGRVGELRGEIG